MKSILAVTLALALSACVSTPSEQVADGNRSACSREAPIGSSIATTRCRSTDQVRQDQENAESVASEIRRSSGSAHAGKRGG
jgi:hypothetical protein